jgi:hypothetical protein
MYSQHLQEYIKQNSGQIEGWVNDNIWEILDYIAEFQTVNKIQGNIMEIGVHHGKFFLGLNSLLGTKEHSVAIDVFEEQNLNIDNSGCGNRKIFEDNISKYAQNKDKISVLKGDSTEVKRYFNKFDNLNQELYRIVSVDGGHTVEHAYEDTIFAESIICSGGIVIVDDYFNSFWPGVNEGINKYFNQRNAILQPVLVGFNKLVLTTFSHQNQYFTYLNQKTAHFPRKRKKIVRMFGVERVLSLL